MKAIVSSALTFAAIAGGLYAALLALLWFGQERLIFLPTPLPADHRFGHGPDVHEVWVDVPGARLHALHLRLPRPDGLVFYLHGNAGNLDGWFSHVDFCRRLNLDLFMLDYRGYGKSGGVESEAQLHADVQAARQRVAPAYTGQRRVILGRSLGSGPALVLAAEAKPELTLLVSPYVSFAALAAQHYPWVPARLLRYPMRNDLAIARITTPLVLVHGARDEVIGAGHSHQLQALAPQALAPQARLVIVPGAGHNDLQEFPAYLDAVAAALRGR